jgi:hypothetical protein
MTGARGASSVREGGDEAKMLLAFRRDDFDETPDGEHHDLFSSHLLDRLSG